MSPSLLRPPATPRRPRVPPVLTRGTERFEGLAILDELTDDLGLLLWRSLRNVLTWARTPEGQRAGLFAGQAAPIREGDLARLSPDPELHAPLSVILALLEAPEKADVARLSNACRRVALWAEDQGSLATALDYAQAAAVVAPDVALLSYHVGRVARRLADYDRAEGWFLRAIIQGRQQKEWRAYTLAFSGLGNLFVQKGNFPEARRFHQRCLRAAVRHSLRKVEGDAAHDLFGICAETSAFADGEQYARQAVEAYQACGHSIVVLSKDIAYVWIMQGYFAQALAVLRTLVPHYPVFPDRAYLMGDISRAAGGAGEVAVFAQAAAEIWKANAQGNASDVVARALLDVAHGAASLEDWAQAEAALARVVEIAEERKEGKVLVTAESMQEFVRIRKRTQAAQTETRTASADELTEQILLTLGATTRQFARC